MGIEGREAIRSPSGSWKVVIRKNGEQAAQPFLKKRGKPAGATGTLGTDGAGVRFWKKGGGVYALVPKWEGPGGERGRCRRRSPSQRRLAREDSLKRQKNDKR